MRRIYSAYGNDRRGDFIPGDPNLTAPNHPDALAMREAPVSIQPLRGHPTFNLERETGTLVCKFNQHEVGPDDIRKALRDYRKEFGVNAVQFIEVHVCAEVMAGPSGVWLVNMGFERQPDMSARTAMYRWRKKAKTPKTVEERTDVG